MKYSVGSRVSFPGHSGERHTGVIVRLNKKTASVVTYEGQQWNVHPSFLTAIGDSDIEVPRERSARSVYCQGE